jgi:hypothetical protein
MHSETAKRLVADGLAAAQRIPAIEAVLKAAGHEEDKLTAAMDALGDIWFSLDEIDAVAFSINLVLEHVEDGQAKTARLFALARALCELVGIVKKIQETAEEALNAVDAARRN